MTEKPKNRHGGRRPNQTGRKPKTPGTKRQTMSVRMPPDAIEFAKSQAASQSRSLGDYVETLIRREMEAKR